MNEGVPATSRSVFPSMQSLPCPVGGELRAEVRTDWVGRGGSSAICMWRIKYLLPMIGVTGTCRWFPLLRDNQAKMLTGGCWPAGQWCLQSYSLLLFCVRVHNLEYPSDDTREHSRTLSWSFQKGLVALGRNFICFSVSHVGSAHTACSNFYCLFNCNQ